LFRTPHERPAQQRAAPSLAEGAGSARLCDLGAARHGVEADYDDVMEVVVALIDEVIAALDSTDMK
jgi:hypothetical protein